MVKLSLAGYLRKNLDIVKERAIPNKWDALFIVFGKEGSGKSTLAAQIAKYLDDRFNINNIVFTPKQFEEAVENCQPESSIVWDEAITGANIASHASTISLSIVSRLTQIRKKRLKIILCFPYLYMLNKYYISRCLGSFYVYAKDFDDRGYSFFYSGNKTEYLYNLMKDRYRMFYKKAINVCRRSFYFKFNQYFPLDEKEYDRKKELARKQGQEENGNIWKDRFIKLTKGVNNDGVVKLTEVAKIAGISPDNLYQVLKRAEQTT